MQWQVEHGGDCDKQIDNDKQTLYASALHRFLKEKKKK